MSSSRSGRLSINVGCVYDDTRVGIAEQRMLGVLGTYADSETGWCFPSYPVLAKRLGIQRAAVGHAITALARCGYLEIFERFDPQTGARLSSSYRLIQDYQLPSEYHRTRDAEPLDPLATVSSYPPLEAAPLATPAVVPPLVSVATLATPASDLKERLIRTTKPDDADSAASQPAAAHEPIVKFSPPTTASPPSPAPKTKPLLPVPKPKPEDEPTNARLSRVVDLILAAKIPVIPDWPRDGAALKRCPASPEEIAACYVAIARGEYGDPHMHKRLSIRYVVSEAINGWLVRDQAPLPSRRTDASPDGARYRKDGSRIYTSSAGSKMPADMQARLDANTRY